MSHLEEKLFDDIIAEGLPPPEREYRFHGTRRWRFDMAYPDKKLAIEVEGGTFGNVVVCQTCHKPVMRRLKNGRYSPVREGGRHNSADGYEKDAEKYSEAAIAGWVIVRVTSNMIKNRKAVEFVRRAYDNNG